jgi:hypothetical protein
MFDLLDTVSKSVRKLAFQLKYPKVVMPTTTPLMHAVDVELNPLHRSDVEERNQLQVLTIIPSKKEHKLPTKLHIQWN